MHFRPKQHLYGYVFWYWFSLENLIVYASLDLLKHQDAQQICIAKIYKIQIYDEENYIINGTDISNFRTTYF